MTTREEPVAGRAVQGDAPEWEPLRRVVGEDGLDTFMWMYEVELADGGRVHVYKHIETRRSMHLDLRGNAYAYAGDEGYRRVPLLAVAAAVLGRAREGIVA